MVDEFLNFVNPALVNPMRGPSADQHEGLWPQIDGCIFTFSIQPAENHIGVNDINLGVGVGVRHQPNLIQGCKSPNHIIRVLVFLYSEVATSCPARVHHFLHALAAELTTVDWAGFSQYGFVHSIGTVIAFDFNNTDFALELILHEDGTALHSINF